MKLAIILTFLTSLAFGQVKQHVNIYNSVGTQYCGVSEVTLQVSRKEITLITEKGTLQLKVLKRKIDQYGTYKCQDKQDRIYYVTPIGDNNGGVGLIFQPVEDYLFTFIVSNKPTCK